MNDIAANITAAAPIGFGIVIANDADYIRFNEDNQKLSKDIMKDLIESIGSYTLPITNDYKNS